MKHKFFLIIFGFLLASCISSSPDVLQQTETANPSSTARPTISATHKPLQSGTPNLTPNIVATNTTTSLPFTVTLPPTNIVPSQTLYPTLGAISELYLKHYGLALYYRTDVWQLGEDDIKRGLLQHTSISNCRIREWGPSEVYGSLLNTVELGKITYQIWGWANPETDTRVRHYLARSGFDNPNAPDIPDIEVVLPYSNSKQCALEASEVLATLHIP